MAASIGKEDDFYVPICKALPYYQSISKRLQINMIPNYASTGKINVVEKRLTRLKTKIKTKNYEPVLVISH